MVHNLALAAVMLSATVFFQFFGLTLVMAVMRGYLRRFEVQPTYRSQAAILLIAVHGLAVLTIAEIWAYALVYLAIGALGDLETALYFSIVTFSSAGYGDVVLGKDWRLFAATEASVGLLILGWSAAFLISTISQLPYMMDDETHVDSPRQRMVSRRSRGAP